MDPEEQFNQELSKLRANDEHFYLDWPTFWARDDEERAWLVEPLLPAGRSVALYAKGGTGKSLLALWLAAGAATGREMFGVHRAPLSVLYLDYEMTTDDLAERLEDMGYGPEVDMGHLHYAVLPSIGPFDTEEGGNAIVARAAAVDANLVIIDTFGRAVAGKENDADTLQAWYRFTGRRLKADGRAFVRIDHAGKDIERGQRGTSAKNDDVDVVWQMTALEGYRFRLAATKRRVNWVPETVELELVKNHEMTYRLLVGAAGYPAGTGSLADLLDDLDIPVEWGRKRAARVLRDKGHKARNESIAAAVRYRQERALKVSPRPDSGASLKSAPDDVGTPEQKPPVSRDGTPSGTPGDTPAESHPAGVGVTHRGHPGRGLGPDPLADDDPRRM